MKPPHGADLEDKFIPIPETGCWIWLGAVDKQGYGVHRIKHTGHNFVHRSMFERHVHALKPGEIVMHTCDTPCCGNPHHLRAGTHRDNTADMITKKRDRLIGERNGRSKINAGDALAIRLSQHSCAEIASTYGLSLTHVYRIRRGDLWRHL